MKKNIIIFLTILLLQANFVFASEANSINQTKNSIELDFDKSNREFNSSSENNSGASDYLTKAGAFGNVATRLYNEAKRYFYDYPEGDQRYIGTKVWSSCIK